MCDCVDCEEARSFLHSHEWCVEHDTVKGDCGCD